MSWQSQYRDSSPADRLAACSRQDPAGDLVPDAGADKEIRAVLVGRPEDEVVVRGLVIAFGRHRVCSVLTGLVLAGALELKDEMRVVAIAQDVLDDLDGLYVRGGRAIPRWMSRTAEVEFRSMDEFES